MSKINNLLGRRFGRLTVVALSPNRSGKRKRLVWICNCDCGNTGIEVVSDHLVTGHTRSCGCIALEEKSKVHSKKNNYDLSGDYGIGYTLNGKRFYFDKEDYDLIKKYCWHYNNDGYITAFRKGAKKYEKNRTIYLHRLIMNAKDDEIVDHKEHNKFDNRKEKLRIGTYSQNLMNVGVKSNNTSGYTGISKYSSDNKYHVEINVNGERIKLGVYKDLEDAIQARKKAEDMYYGEWSYTNSLKDAI